MKNGRTKKKEIPETPPPASSFDPNEFDDIDLSKAIPTEDNAEEFDEFVPDLGGVTSEPISSRLLSAKQQFEEEFLFEPQVEAFSARSGTRTYGFENVVGVGIGEKMTNGQFSGGRCITVYVVSKESEENIAPQALVPKTIGGVPTDVVATGELHAFPHRGTYRPAPGGVSIGHYQVTAGTLGCLVRRGSQLFILSNNHVLANSNTAQVGDPILQPGPFDGGQLNQHVIAQLSQFVPIRFDGQPNLVDAAIAQTSPSLVTPQSKCFGTINANPLDAKLFFVVKKCGRTTQLTRGLVTDVNATVKVGYGSQGTAIFQDQIIVLGVPFVYPFSNPGDSGSLVLHEFTNRPVGLLFAGSFTHTIVNKIQNVLSALNVSIVS